MENRLIKIFIFFYKKILTSFLKCCITISVRRYKKIYKQIKK